MGDAANIVVAVLFVLPPLVSTVWLAFKRWRAPGLPESQPPPPTLERVGLLAEQLGVASESISVIEREVRERQQVVEKLMAEAEEAAALKELSEPQAQAVKRELERIVGGQQAKRWDVQITAVSVVGSSVMGVLLTLLAQWFLK